MIYDILIETVNEIKSRIILKKKKIIILKIYNITKEYFNFPIFLIHLAKGAMKYIFLIMNIYI